MLLSEIAGVSLVCSSFFLSFPAVLLSGKNADAFSDCYEDSKHHSPGLYFCSTDHIYIYGVLVQCFRLMVGCFYQWASWRAALHRISRLYSESRNGRLEELNFEYERRACLYCLPTPMCRSTEIATYDDGSGIVRNQILVPVIYACWCSS